jgi:hypothetical protein
MKQKSPYRQQTQTLAPSDPWYFRSHVTNILIIITVLSLPVLFIITCFLFSFFLPYATPTAQDNPFSFLPMLILLSLFLIPFVAIGLLIAAAILRSRYQRLYGEWQPPAWLPRRAIARNQHFRLWKFLILLASLPPLLLSVSSFPDLLLSLFKFADSYQGLYYLNWLLFWLLYIFLCLRALWRTYLLWRLERRRQTRAEITSPWRPMQRDISLPPSILLRQNRKNIWFRMHSVFTMIALIFTSLTFYNILDSYYKYHNPYYFNQSAFEPVLQQILLTWLIVFLLTCITLVFTFLPSFQARFAIEASESGMVSKRGRLLDKTQMVNWEEVHLFASYRLPSLMPWRRPITVYELSTPYASVCWFHEQRPHSCFATYEPLIPANEYEQQMQELCELVKKRTGLELERLG